MKNSSSQKGSLIEGVTRKFQSDGSVTSGNNIVHVESIFGRSVNEVVDGVTLVDLLHESVNRHGLLPELQISNQFVALSVVAEGNIVVVLLGNDNVRHDGFSLVSAGLDLLLIGLGGGCLDTHVVQSLQQSLLVEKLSLDGTEMAVERGRSTSISGRRSERMGAGSGNSEDDSSESLHGNNWLTKVNMKLVCRLKQLILDCPK
mmetsp:Transcript_978/g.2146  ORF Transcript_978/g.2146 Transcript_978/m.2146 type:complete len:203 (+) Transcript_978:1155-1763(+)